MSHKYEFISFYGGRMICVTGLRGYWGTELNNMILMNNHEFTLPAKNIICKKAQIYIDEKSKMYGLFSNFIIHISSTLS